VGLELIQRAVQIDPQIHFFSNLGKIYDKLGQFPAAVACYRQYLTAQPNDLGILGNLSACLIQQSQFEEALPLLERMIALRPQQADAWANLAIVWRAKKEFTRAIECAEQALKLDPQNADNWSNLGTIYRKLKKHRRAIECYESALKIRPGYPVYLSNLGNVYDDLCEHTTAEKVLQLALKSDPNHFDALYNLSNVYRNLGKHSEAITLYRQLLQRAPNHADIHTTLAVLALYHKDFDFGWQEFEWRWKLTPPRPYTQPWWNGEPLAGKTILLWSEQGLGDTLHFIRYIPLLKTQGARVALSCQGALIPLLKDFPGIDELLPVEQMPSEFDYHLPLMSLPRVFHGLGESIPTSIPYLFADEIRMQQWQARLAHLSGYRIGIVWQGNKDYMSDHVRSIPLKTFAPLAALPNVSLVSLQFGYGTEQAVDTALPFRVHSLGSVDQDGAFLDTAAILKNLDLLVCSDTSIVHLAGALGVPTMLALNISPNWRWHEGETASSWYPSVQLFKQTTAGDWSGVMSRIAAAIRSRLASEA
jgi:tetratricopeptide (TPR) repeat protein